RLMCRMAEMGTNVRPLGSSSITPASPTCTSLPSSVAAGDAGKPPPRRSATDTTLPAHSPISDPMFVLFEVRLIPPATPTCVFVRVGPPFRHRLCLSPPNDPAQRRRPWLGVISRKTVMGRRPLQRLVRHLRSLMFAKSLCMEEHT